MDTTAPLQTVSFSSMSKDSGQSSSDSNSNWTTADASAGRILSGAISAPLAAGEMVLVYANETLIGQALVKGTQWHITDTQGYNANWTYTAQVVDGGGSVGPMATRTVILDTSSEATGGIVNGTTGPDSLTVSSTHNVVNGLAGNDTISAPANVQALLAETGLKFSKHEISALFRKPGHKHYRECEDQLLRNVLKGLQTRLRKPD
jgi:hypothetical protein